MALEQDKVIKNYMTAYHGITAHVHDAGLKAQLNAIFDSVLFSHCKERSWKFRESAEEALTTVGAYAESTTLKTIKAARLTGKTYFLRNISYVRYQKWVARSATTSTTPSWAAIYNKRIYPYPVTSAGVGITASGLLNTTNKAVLLAAIPEDHETALHLLLDVRINRGSRGSYENEISQLSIDDGRDRDESFEQGEMSSIIQSCMGE